MSTRVKKWKRTVVLMLCVLTVLGMCQNVVAAPDREEGNGSGTVSGDDIGPGNGSSDLGELSGEMLSGVSSDISISGVKVSGTKAGGNVEISFTATGNKNRKKKYEVDRIERVYPVLNEGFPFAMEDEAYRVTSGSGNSVHCSYRFRAKDTLETGYYLAGFTVVYSRCGTDGNATVYDSEYYVNKDVSVKLKGKKSSGSSSDNPAQEDPASDGDISLKMSGTPHGSYGGKCRVAFTAYSSKYKITDVVPAIGEGFPFESTSAAYRVTHSKGTKKLKCRYTFRVKKDVADGYQAITFKITYLKGKTPVTADKTVNVRLKGKKPKEAAAGANDKKSTPRVMVTGYDTDVKKITPNSKFNLKLHIKNNASQAVKNVKFTLSTANGEFLPVSGASTAYVESIGAKGTVTISFKMKAAASLGSRSYPMTIKAEYEDGKANAFDSQDNVSIPVTLKDRISLTEMTPPDVLSVGGEGDLAFSINNMGAGTLNNVTVQCKGDGVDSEETFVGNIAAGASGYANVPLTGVEATPEDSDGECTIVISYENSAGDSNTYEEKVPIFVEDDMDKGMDSEEDMEIMEGEEGDRSGGISPLFIVIPAVVVLIIAAVVVHHIWKKKRLKKEEELIDDELL